MRRVACVTSTVRSSSCWTCSGRDKKLDEAAIEEFSYAQELLAALPLATDDYGRAVLRLENAIRYLRACEPGAAAYELKMLSGGLRVLLESTGDVRRNGRVRTEPA